MARRGNSVVSDRLAHLRECLDPADGPRRLGIQEHCLYADASCSQGSTLPTVLYDFKLSDGFHRGCRCTCYHLEHKIALGKSRIYRIDYGTFRGSPPASFKLELEDSHVVGKVIGDGQIEIQIREGQGYVQLHPLHNRKFFHPVSSAWFNSDFFYRTEPMPRRGQLDLFFVCAEDTHVLPEYDHGACTFHFPILSPSKDPVTIHADSKNDDAVCRVPIISWHTQCLRDCKQWPALGITSVSDRQQILLGTLAEVRQQCPQEMFAFSEFAGMEVGEFVGQISVLLQQAGILALLDQDVDGATRLACVVLDLLDSVRLAVPRLLQEAKSLAEKLLTRYTDEFQLAGACVFVDEFVMESAQIRLLAITIARQLEEKAFEDMHEARGVSALVCVDDDKWTSSWPALRIPVVAQMAAMQLARLVRSALRGSGTRKISIQDVRGVFAGFASLRRLREIFSHFCQGDPYNIMEFLDLELMQMDYDSFDGKHHGHWPKTRRRDCLVGGSVHLVSGSRKVILPLPSASSVGMPSRCDGDEIKLTLRVDPELGAGLELSATRWGMRVDMVDEQPGQAGLTPGDMITMIDGVSLVGLAGQDAVEEAFASGFHDGAELCVDLRRVQALPLPPEYRMWPASFEEDVCTMSENFEIRVTLLASSIEMVGPSRVMEEAKEEVQHIFSFYAGGSTRTDVNVHTGQDLEDFIWEDPWLVRFTQASISSSFRVGTPVDQMIEDIMDDRMHPYELPPLELVRHTDGHLYSLSNRRLFVFRVLRSFGKVIHLQGRLYKSSHVRVQRKKIDEESGELLSKWDRSFSTENGGRSVQVKSRYSDRQESLT